jgi:hypothetical protein
MLANLAVVERWRESGAAPDQLQAYHVTNNRVDMAGLCVLTPRPRRTKT